MEQVEYTKTVPVIGAYDVVICGAGPAGWVAAVSCARRGKRTALIESLAFPGGGAAMTYVAPICGVFHEETRVLHGIGWEFVQGLIAAGAARVEHAPPEVPIGPHNYRGNVSYHPEYYKLHCAEMLRKAGVEMFTNCRVIDCDCENGHVSRVYFAGKNGIEVLDCAHVIDATGDGTLAKLAGVPMLDNDNLLPMSLCFLLEGADTSTPLLGDYIHHDGRTFNGSNPVIHDYLIEYGKKHPELPQFGGPWFVSLIKGSLLSVVMTRRRGDGADREQLTKTELLLQRDAFALVDALREGFPEFRNAEIAAIAPMAGIRETGRIRGVHTLTQEEVLEAKPFNDVIAWCAHPMDFHSPIDNSQRLIPLEKPAPIPFETVIAPGFDNLYAVGRCSSLTGGAYASARVQATCMMMGENAAKHIR